MSFVGDSVRVRSLRLDLFVSHFEHHTDGIFPWKSNLPAGAPPKVSWVKLSNVSLKNYVPVVRNSWRNHFSMFAFCNAVLYFLYLSQV